MSFTRKLLTNSPLANIAFVVVLVLGWWSYVSMPREQDPEINFNWVSVTAVLPGATAEDVEQLITNPLEDAIKGVPDVRFVTSSSRENVSSLLVRFREVNERTFDKRMADLRREIQNKASSELPREAKDPLILEITTSNGFPTASLMLIGQADDETLRLNGRRIQSDLERLKGVDKVYASGLRDPEILVSPNAEALATRGLQSTDVADALAAWWRDTSAGKLRTQEGAWSISLQGVSTDAEILAHLPITSALRPGVSARLEEVARIERSRATASQYAASNGQNAIALSVTKKSGINTLALVDTLSQYISAQNTTLAVSGLSLMLTDDQTIATRDAVDVMESNALFGMVLVMGVCWLFLGGRVGLLVTLGIPFSLMGTFAVLNAMGQTINVSVLLGVVIALGMLVDDAVVVVESIYYRMQRGQPPLEACLDAIEETWQPVLASVATTVAAFLPLMLLPGILGKFMFVIPFVVTLALIISLIEAFWMMPVHVIAMKHETARPSKIQTWRDALNRGIRLRYGQGLAYILRRPIRFALVGVLAVGLALGLMVVEAVRVQFFSFEPIRAFYVNVDMPPNASLEETLQATQHTERAVRAQLLGVGPKGEARAVTSTAGLKFTDTEPVYGDAYGQVFVSLNPRTEGAREVTEVVEALRGSIEALPGPGRRSFTQLSGGPPAGKAISVKVRGDNFDQIQAAVEALKVVVAGIAGTKDVQDDNLPGRPQLQLRLNPNAVRDSGLNPAQIARMVRLAVDGEVVAFTREEGDKIELRVRSSTAGVSAPVEAPGLGLVGGVGGASSALPIDPARILSTPIALPSGQTTHLGALVHVEAGPGKGLIKHYNLRRTITVEANLDKEITDTRQANEVIRESWQQLRTQYPGIDIDLSGELEDIEESLAAMQVLFLMGLGLIYLILAAQFQSYFQPLMILVTVPLAFAGVVFGLALSGNPLSLYTLYGVIALMGIAVNSAIVLIDAANDRQQRGFSLVQAIVWASRRRVIPILITSTTTIGGLVSLAFGIGGKSLLWGPVAASIVWGLTFSTVLTLFIVPLLYMAFMRPKKKLKQPLGSGPE